MAVRPSPSVRQKPADEWVSNVDGLRYPADDESEKRVASGEVCSGAASEWPPQWVIDAGWVRPAQESSAFAGNNERSPA